MSELRDDLIAMAAPPCHECGEPVTHVEMPWRLDDDGQWVLADSFMICGDGHRVQVEPL